MLQHIYKETTSETLLLILDQLMDCPLLSSFRLAGGTGLSLQIGNRISDDIDLFTLEEYGTINFKELSNWLEKNFNYFACDDPEGSGFGLFCFVGNSEKESVKLDILYHDTFISIPESFENIRLATVEDIAAMKIGVITGGGRKKDFWDLHSLLDRYTLKELIDFYLKMYPYNDLRNLYEALIDFERADKDEDPRCLMNKDWELIKLDIEEAANDHFATHD